MFGGKGKDTVGRRTVAIRVGEGMDGQLRARDWTGTIDGAGR